MWSTKVKKFADEEIHISGDIISVKRGELQHGDLRYWQKNPRIYSIVHASDDPLNQDQIQSELQKHDHVKQLYRDIKHHGGLIDPIVVIDKTFEVIEGNSRLAAVRLLCKKDPRKFGKLRCIVLPDSISVKTIYSYLNQEHIQGKHQWSPYEQAGVIYRLIQDGLSFNELSEELGIGAKKARSMHQIYKFMVEHGEDKPSRYSYYEVYLTNRKASKKREAENGLDDMIIKEIHEEYITAQEFRKMLPHVVENPKQLAKFVSGKSNMLGAYEELERQGKTEDLVRKLKRMHTQIREMNKDEFDSLSAKAQKTAEYELNRIITLCSNLKKNVYG